MSDNFLDNLNKYSVLGEYNKKSDKICFDYFDGDRCFYIGGNEECINSTLLVQVGSANALKVYIDDIKVYDYAGITNAYIPIMINKSKCMRVVGNCTHLVIVIDGGRFINRNRSYYLNQINTVVEDSGIYNIVRYDSLADYISGNKTIVKSINDVKCAQSYTYNNEKYCGVICGDDGIYFTSSIDSYISRVLIVDSCDDIVILENVESGYLTFVYTRLGDVYRVDYNLATHDVGGVVQITPVHNFDNGVVVGLFAVQFSNNALPYVAINISNNYAVVYDIKLNIIVNKHKVCDNNSLYIIKNNEIIIFQKLYKNMKIFKIIFELRNGKYLINQTNYASKDNIDHVIVFGNKYVVFNCLNATVMDDLF